MSMMGMLMPLFSVVACFLLLVCSYRKVEKARKYLLKKKKHFSDRS